MATRKVKLTGIGYWAKVFEDYRDLTGYENALKDAGGQCTIDVDLDAESMAKLVKSKTMLKGKPSPDNDGLTRVRFKRKWEEAYAGGAPKVVKADGTVWDYDEDGSIGNGSTVDVILNVYDTKRKGIIGTRLEKVKVTKHVEYNPDEDEEEGEAPPPAKSTTKPAPKTYKVEDDDEISF